MEHRKSENMLFLKTHNILTYSHRISFIYCFWYYQWLQFHKRAHTQVWGQEYKLLIYMDLWHSKGKDHVCLHKCITPSLEHCRSSEAIKKKRSSGNGVELDWKAIYLMSLWGVCESRSSVLDLKHNENWETGVMPCVIMLHCWGTKWTQNTFSSLKVLNRCTNVSANNGNFSHYQPSGRADYILSIKKRGRENSRFV